MKYVLAIYGDPVNSQSGNTALNFANALIKKGHSIEHIFFYLDGVQQANQNLIFLQDEINLPKQWSLFVAKYKLEAVVCIAAALQRGVMNKEEASRYHINTNNLATHFQLSGLGQLVSHISKADRFIAFGN